MTSITKLVKAVYQGGVLKPLQALNLPDNIHVWILITPAVGEKVSAQEERFRLQLLQLGLLREIKAPSGISEGNRTPVRVKGKPLSRLIIEERR